VVHGAAGAGGRSRDTQDQDSQRRNQIRSSVVVARWLPALPDANRVTLKMLANMTSGYPDYVPTNTLIAELSADPFRAFTGRQLVAIAL
jgi:CubicO group peptidase (beta-lactamase class C family)